MGASVAMALGPKSFGKRAASRLQVVAALLAIVPDLDFFFLWVLRMGPGWHRAFAHSIVFSLAVSALVGAAFRAEWKRVFPVLWAATASHCLLDALTSRLAPGVELFWPFYLRRYAAGWVDYFDFSIRVRGPLEFLTLILKISLVEALIFIPPSLAVWLITNKLRSHERRKIPIEQQEIG
jgi:membrane-bound metal-dependent hydrolase YbcI (DUF457 family)